MREHQHTTKRRGWR